MIMLKKVKLFIALLISQDEPSVIRKYAVTEGFLKIKRKEAERMDLIQQVANQIPVSDDPLVVAVSTGVDSMVLLHVLLQLKVPIVVAHVNHRLRPQSDQEAAWLTEFCAAHQIPLVIKTWEHPPSHGIETAAREFRYQFFASVMKKYQSSVLLTAHHQNDLVETIFMKLTRGGWWNNLIGIQPVRSFAGGKLVRPLLGCSKASLLAWATTHHVTWFEDETNQDSTILRNWFRRQLNDQWRKKFPQLGKHIQAYSEQLATVEATLAAYLTQVTSQLRLGQHFSLVKWRQLDGAVQRSWLQMSWQTAGIRDVSWDQLKQIQQQLMTTTKSNGTLMLAHGWQIKWSYEEFWWQKVDKTLKTTGVKAGDVVELEKQYFVQPIGQVTWQTKPTTDHLLARFELRADQLPLIRRPWQAGDRIRLAQGGHQKVRRILIDQKVPVDLRPQQMVVVTKDQEVLWVEGRKVASLPPVADGIELYLYQQGEEHT